MNVTDNITSALNNSSGMKIGDWITVIAVIVALGLGVRSIIQTHILQKKERRQILLNEIIEWLRSINKRNFIFASKEMFEIVEHTLSEMEQLFIQSTLASLEEQTNFIYFMSLAGSIDL